MLEDPFKHINIPSEADGSTKPEVTPLPDDEEVFPDYRIIPAPDVAAGNWSGRGDGITPPMTPEFRVIENTWLGKENGLPPPLPEQTLVPPPLPEAYVASFANQSIEVPTFPLTPTVFSEVQVQPGEKNPLLLKEWLSVGGESPMTKAEKMEMLTPEALANLTTEEYIEVWKKLSPHFVSHVTRQGYRENHFHSHSAGRGKFQNGFTSILEGDRNLKSPRMLANPEGDKQFEGGLVNFLESVNFSEVEADDNGLEDYPNPWKKIKARLRATMGAPKTPDENALHLATEKVLDGMYGAETDNQIFFIFPSDMVASQFNFAFNGGKFGQSFNTLPEGEPEHNDVFVWDKDKPEQTSLSVDSGIAFLPKSTQVDAKTGSKYSDYKLTYGGQGENDVIETTAPSEVVTAEEYWERYFAQSPEKRPKHVIYYDGDPSDAVQEFLKSNGIGVDGRGQETGGNLDFSENHVANMNTDKRTLTMDKKALAHGANAVAKFFQAHPELSYKNLMSEEDILEMSELLGKYDAEVNFGDEVKKLEADINSLESTAT